MKYVVYAGTRTAGFCFICGFRLDVGCCVVAVVERAQEVLVGYAVMLHFLLVDKNCM